MDLIKPNTNFFPKIKGKEIIKGAVLTSATVPWHGLIFCPGPKVSTYIGCPKKRPLESPKWHWLFLPPIGANGDR